MGLRILKVGIPLAAVFGIVTIAARAFEEPVRIAATARFDLTADRQTGALENGRVLTGAGSISRMNWAPAADQPRGYTVSLPVNHFGWHSVSIQFTPARFGNVTLT